LLASIGMNSISGVDWASRSPSRANAVVGPMSIAPDQLTRATDLDMHVTQRAHVLGKSASTEAVVLSDDFAALNGGMERARGGQKAAETTAHYSKSIAQGSSRLSAPMALVESTLGLMQQLGLSAAGVQGTHLPGM